MEISAVVALVAIGAALGALLGIANIYLTVEEDNRVVQVTEMLPGANCGGCGFPGCSGFANALVDGSATKVSGCAVCNPQVREEIAKYLNETPGPDGTCVKVTV